MEEDIFKELRSKSFFTPQDINFLLITCDRMFERNKDISEQLKAALERLDILHRRLEFYRNTTFKELK